MKIWYAVEIEIARVAESAATAQLWASNTTGIEVSEDASDFLTLRAYFDSPVDRGALRLKIIEGLGQISLPEEALRRLEVITIADQDWLAEWKKGYEPIEVGRRLLVSPSWKRDQIRDSDRIVIEIDPGMAFGTGTHETTRGCLEMLEKYWHGGSLLDVGTGTGILSIAACKLHPGSRITAIDVDPEAIDVARENTGINGVADEIDLEVNRLSSFFDHDFDLVLANLTADVIIPLAAEFPQVMSEKGVLVVSGILREQEADVCAALTKHNLTVIETIRDGEWVTIALNKSA